MQPRVEIYGPAGLRLFVRQIMKMTLTRTADKYVVHELLTPSDSITPCVPRAPNADPTEFNITQSDIMHYSELAGSDLYATTITGEPQAEGVSGGYWYSITTDNGHYSPITVSAGSILHRDPCLGYIFQETSLPARKLVILGDTYDPTYISPLCVNPPPSLLIHEATDSCISRSADAGGNLSRRTEKEVTEKALSRGHSTPEMAGLFAKLVGAEELVLNHIGGRYAVVICSRFLKLKSNTCFFSFSSYRFPAPRHPRDFKRRDIIRDIEKRASSAWGAQDKSALAAYDFLRVYVPMPNAIALVEKAAQLNYGYAHIVAQRVSVEASGSVSGYAHTQTYAGHVAGNAPSNDRPNNSVQENPGNDQSYHGHGRGGSHRGRGRGRGAGNHEHGDADGDSKGRTHPYPRPSHNARDNGE